MTSTAHPLDPNDTAVSTPRFDRDYGARVRLIPSALSSERVIMTRAFKPPRDRAKELMFVDAVVHARSDAARRLLAKLCGMQPCEVCDLFLLHCECPGSEHNTCIVRGED